MVYYFFIRSNPPKGGVQKLNCRARWAIKKKDFFLNSRLMFFCMALPVFAVCGYSQWSASENDALTTTPGAHQATYMIKKGDTLWDLAFQFLGDPFKWPELWHANEYIKNPNLIFPGDSLAIPGRGGKGAAAGTAPETESMTSLSLATGFGDHTASGSGSGGLSEQEGAPGDLDIFTDSLVTATVFRNDFFTADLIGRSGLLWFARDAKGLIYPGNASIATTGGAPLKTIFRQFDEISIDVFGKTSYSVGDTVDVFHCDRFLKFKGKTANLVRRTGRAQVIAVTKEQVKAILFKAWDVVSEGDRIDTAAHFPTLEIDTIVDRDVVIRGTVFERIEQTESPYLFQTMICDRGTQDGVRLGDIFLVRPHQENKNTGRCSALGCIIHAGGESSTLVIEKLFDIAVAPGDTVELIKRVRFK
jgi:hypothetical protein